MMTERTGQVYEFGDFRLIPDEGLLLRSEEEVYLPSKAFATLVLLVKHRGHLVKKNDILDTVWGDSFVEEAVIPQCISSIRNALGENSKSPTYIRTEPKRGYRFIAEVTISGDSGISMVPADNADVPKNRSSNGHVISFERPVTHSLSLAVATAEPKTEKAKVFPSPEVAEIGGVSSGFKPRLVTPTKRKTSAVTFISLIAVALLVVSAGVFMLSGPSQAFDSSGPALKFAVLPLKPVSADHRDTIVEFAIAESLILKMSTASNLSVRPLSAVRKYIELDRDPLEAGKELNVDYVLSSNYQIVDGRIRVTSQLFDTRTGKTEATFRSEGEAVDRFSMQDAVANEIGNALFARFGHSGNIYTAKRGTSSEEAYRLYLQGQYLVDKKTRKDAARAIEIFDEALALDPNFPHAWAGKAGAHCTFAHFGGREPKIAFSTAKPALNRAFELDPNLAEAHAVRGIITFDYDWEFEDGLKHFRKAMEINPQHEMARRWYANRLALLGRYDEALTEIKAVIDINPSSLFHQWDLANILYQARRYDEAVIQLQRVLEMDPNMAWAPRLIWVSYHMKGDTEQAYAWFMRFQENGNSDQGDIEAYKKAYETTGWNGVLETFSEILLKRYKMDQYDPSSRGIVLAASLLGDKDTAFKFAGEGLKYRDLWAPYLLNDPAFEPLQHDPRFEKLLRDAGIPSSPSKKL